MISKKTKTTIRRWNSAIHRDLGYFFVGLTIIYGVSGIALNHLKDWNPNYVQNIVEVDTGGPLNIGDLDKQAIIDLLKPYHEDQAYNKHYFPNNQVLKVYLKGGTMILDLSTGKGRIERLTKRWMFNQFNFLHYNAPKRLWTLISDIYAVSLIILAISGLFILKGKKGLKWRGTWIGLAGIILPFAIYFYYI
jgi:hypothetical protein